MESGVPIENAEPVSGERDFPWLPLGLVLLVALVLRLLQLDHAPHFDEFYHLLAANSLLDDGDLCIADCLRPYDRGAPFTYLVAGAVGLFGRSLIVARLVSVVAGILLVAGVFWWTWRVAGKTAASIAALLLALSPEAIYVSQFIRFYAWQALLVWIGGTALFFAVHPPAAASRRRRIALAGLAALALLGALSLQVTTMIAGVGLGVWLLIDPVADWTAREVRHRPWRLAAVAAAALVVAAMAVLFALRAGILAELWADYRSVNMFEVTEANDIRFYHRFFLDSYPTFYTLLPAAFVIALWKRPAAAKFCAAVFGVALVIHSGGGFKATRFLFYAMPFFFALWGIALATVLPLLVSAGRKGMAAWLGTDAGSRLAAIGGAVLLGFVAVSVLATNSAYNTTLKMVTLSDAEWPRYKPAYRGRPEWRPAVATVRAITDTAEVVVTTASVKAIYYLGRSDVELSASRLFTRSGFMPDFSLDPRVGRPAIKSVEAMDRLVSCYRSGVVVLEKHAWETAWGTLPETAAYIAGHTQEVSLPAGSDLRVFRWGSDTREGHASCDPPPLTGSRAAARTR